MILIPALLLFAAPALADTCTGLFGSYDCSGGDYYGLSSGARWGIGIAIIVVIFALTFMAFYFRRRSLARRYRAPAPAAALAPAAAPMTYRASRSEPDLPAYHADVPPPPPPPPPPAHFDGRKPASAWDDVELGKDAPPGYYEAGA
ncbi:hypothetical protein Q5752_004290 [Cryptotrichosporon argae]